MKIGRNLRNLHGITLIALVISIIVLLILSAVTISALTGDNGILLNSINSKKQSEIGNEKEQVQLAVAAVLTKNLGEKIEKEQLTIELENQFGTEGDKWEYVTPSPINVCVVKFKESERIYVVNESGDTSEGIIIPPTTKVEKNTYFIDTTSGDKIAVIPEGFRVSSVPGENTEQSIDKGLVVIGPDGSEFVWVPVADVTTMYGTLADGTKAGKIYDWDNLDSDGNPANLNWTEATTDGKTVMSIGLTSGDGSYREPDTISIYDSTASYLNIIKRILTDDESQSNYANITSFKTTMQKDFKSMIESVEKYRGFYIARYEMSLNSETNKAQFIKNQPSATNANNNSNRWYGLYARAKEYSTSSTQGSMVWGSQYDAMIKWMKENNVNVTNATPITGAVRNSDSERRTGYVETDKILNIYDILGNSYEWTLEAYSTNYRALRGGNYCDSIYSPSHRFSFDTSYSYVFYSTRTTLYIR